MHDTVEFVLGQGAVARMQGKAGSPVNHAVALPPGQQLQQLPRPFQWQMVAQLLHVQCAAVEAPVGLPFVCRQVLADGQHRFAQIRADAGIDELDLAGLALEGGIQTTAEQ